MDITEYEVYNIPVKDIKVDGENPNKMDEKTKKRLLSSMQEFGNTQPIVVDKESMILADGEHRLKQYIAAGKKEIPTILVPFKDDIHRRAYRQAANKIHGMHDNELDAREFMKLVEAEQENLLQIATGMSSGIVKQHIRKYGNSRADDPEAEEDNYDPSVEPEGISVNCGEVWMLGNHLLMCGDSTDPQQVATIMGESKADAVFIDPPYNVNFHGTVGKFKEMENDNIEEDDYQLFTKVILNNLHMNGKKSTTYYICIDFRNYSVWEKEVKEKNMSVMNCIVWDKVYPGLWQKYRFRHEFIIYAGDRNNVNWKGTGASEDIITIEEDTNIENPTNVDRKGVYLPLQNDKYLRIKIEDKMSGGVEVLEGKSHKLKVAHGPDDLWQGYSMNNFVARGTEESEGIVHPTMKPIRLVADLIKNSTDQGDIVVDLCGGSGSTLVACEQINRKCRMMELDEKYCATIIDRWQKLTGEKAKKIAEGEKK